MGELQILENFIGIVQQLFPECVEKDECRITQDTRMIDPKRYFIRVCWKTRDDLSRPNKRINPIIIELHEDFGSSSFAEYSNDKIRKEFSAFIRNKRKTFEPTTTDNPDQSPRVETWIFPPKC